MFLIYGRRRARIKKTQDFVGACSSCNSIGLEFEIFREYFHLFWIPIFPFGDKESVVYCKNCGKSNNHNPRVKHVESVTRTPIYLYMGLVAFGLMIGSVIFMNLKTQKEKAEFVSDPKIGDVYLMKNEETDTTFYFFLRVTRIQNDTVIVYPNAFQYFGFVSNLNNEDYFIGQEYFYTKDELRQLLEESKLVSVNRGYDESENFNKVRFIPTDSLGVEDI